MSSTSKPTGTVPLGIGYYTAANDDTLELGFRDLIELRFVAAFIAEGLALQTIRACLSTARELVDCDHPFSTRRFKTDGKRIFLETVHRLEARPADLSNLPPLPRRSRFPSKANGSGWQATAEWWDRRCCAAFRAMTAISSRLIGTCWTFAVRPMSRLGWTATAPR